VNIYDIHTHTRNPASCPPVEAYQFTDDESGERIARWIEALRGRGAALYDNGRLFVPAEQYAAPGFIVPLGWYVYREGFSDRIHVAPERSFDWNYEVKK
jgi:hypothetical protein